MLDVLSEVQCLIETSPPDIVNSTVLSALCTCKLWVTLKFVGNTSIFVLPALEGNTHRDHFVPYSCCLL